MENFIIDNRKRGTVGEYLKENIDKDSKLSIVSAYFTVYAFNELKKELNGIKELRFLFGEPAFVKDDNLKERKEFIIDKTKREFNLSDNEVELILKNEMLQKGIARECASWIRKKVQIKSLIKPDFLHGKCYIIENKKNDKKAVVGSSNFTVSGLGLKEQSNMELNVFSENKSHVIELLEWFDEIWNNEELVEDVKEEVLKSIETLYIENSPEFLYFVTIYNIFRSFLEESEGEEIVKKNIGFEETEIWNKLYDFQKDGVIGAINKLEKYGGCIIADSVGLGKTFEALAIIKYYELRNYRVLVLAPKKLRENWSIYKSNNTVNTLNDIMRYDLLNHTDLSRNEGKSGDIDLAIVNWGNYDFVIIDESHNFRNNPPVKDRKTRYEKLMEDIIKSGVKTKVLMLSATPVNNKMNDLKNQINFITAGNDRVLKDTIGINSINRAFAEAQRNFNNWTKLPTNKRTTDTLLDTLNIDYFNILNTFTIARSRKHIKKYYNSKDIGDFPKRLKPNTKKPDIDFNNEFPSYKVINNNILKLHLALYSPLAYVRWDKRDEYSKKYDIAVKEGQSIFKQTDREKNLVYLLCMNLLKRLESSVNSFAKTLEKLAFKVNTALLNLNTYEGSFEELSINDIDIESDEVQEELFGSKIKVLINDLDKVKLKQHLEEDREILQFLYNEAIKIDENRDLKLRQLKTFIKNKSLNPINDNNRKILIFTAFADTAKYLYESIQEWALKELGLYCALVTGSDENRVNLSGLKSEFNTILTNFSPLSKEREKGPYKNNREEIDILIATDCISEGQNLQDCDTVINYDIHWNPVRIIQRFGRIDRLGSKNEKIQMVNFWPNLELDEYINLEKRVKDKMMLLDISATGEDNLISSQEKMNDLEYRKKQLEQLQKEVVDIEDMSDGISITDLTLDDIKMDLIKYMKENGKKVKTCPTGIYSIVPIKEKFKNELKPGVIFCVKNIKENNNIEDKNSLHPYYLVYIDIEGNILITHDKPKKILDIYKGLCLGDVNIYENLCNAFNKETHDGFKMDKYSNMLNKCLSSILGIKQEKIAQSIFKFGDTGILNNKFDGADDFALITFLILRS